MRDAQGRIRLFYTGNRKEPTGYRGTRRIPSINQVFVANPGGEHGGFYRKDSSNPLVSGAPPGFTGHVRDPQITRRGERWLMVLGAQREDRTAAVVTYLSSNLDHWEFSGELGIDAAAAEPGSAPVVVPGGYMWECPNLIDMVDEADGKTYQVLILCPQGLARIDEESPAGKWPLTHFANSDQCGYLVGRLELGVGTAPLFRVLRGFSELDYGYEFYAPQAIPDSLGGALLVAWMGLPGSDAAPSVADGWVHMLTLPRRLRLVHGRILQEPVVGTNHGAVAAVEPRAVMRVDVDCSSNSDAELVLSDTAGVPALRLSWHASGEVLSITRAPQAGSCAAADVWDQAGSAEREEGNRPSTEAHAQRDRLERGDTRRIASFPGRLSMLIDGPAIEIFAGNGQVAASVVAWPSPGAEWVRPRATYL